MKRRPYAEGARNKQSRLNGEVKGEKEPIDETAMNGEMGMGNENANGSVREKEEKERGEAEEGA